MTLTTPIFDFFDQEEKTLAATKEKEDLKKEIENHHKFLRMVWKEWDGPKVDSTTIGGYCSVHSPIVHSITHNEQRYHYMAPCRIDSISDDCTEFEVTIEYEKGSTCEHYNGERLRLHILEVWAPTQMIIANQHANR